MPHGGGDPFAGLGPELDSPDEIRDDLRDAGLNPMDVDTPEEATAGHSLTHAFADDADMGGRTAEQLEAEHAMTVDAMHDFGISHDTQLDL